MLGASSAPEYPTAVPSSVGPLPPLPTADRCPVLAAFAGRPPAESRAVLAHRTFCAIHCYLSPTGGGLVVLVTHALTVLSMDYHDDDELTAAWSEAIESYARPVLQVSTNRRLA